MGKLKIGYRETIDGSVKKTLGIKTELKSGNYDQFELTLELVPLRDEENRIEDNVNVVFSFPRV